MEKHDRLACLEAVGIAGDRYALGTGHYSERPGSGRRAILVEYGTLEALARDHGTNLKPKETRRNVLTEGGPLNQLVGHRLRIGSDVILEPIRLSTPRHYLEDLAGHTGLSKALVNRSGPNRRIVAGGTVLAGEPVRPG